MRIQWGRCHRGRVWHLLDEAAQDTWCRSGDPIIEWTHVPPLGGRPCPRCTAAVRELAAAVDAAEEAAERQWLPVALLEPADLDDDVQTFRPIETVDLLAGADECRAAELRLRNEGPDPQADEQPEDGAA